MKEKICFIICVSDDRYFNECMLYISDLTVPVDIETEFICVYNAKSLTSVYNKALESTDSKYKVYLHQDAFILNKDFIIDILKIFRENKQVGILGVAGTKKMPNNGIWWEEKEATFGKIHHMSGFGMFNQDFSKQASSKEFEYVVALDGVLIATQYDIKWREDLFDGWHFYDISQCYEFSIKGYHVVIPNQISPWVMHAGKRLIKHIGKDYEEYREIFLKEYNENLEKYNAKITEMDSNDIEELEMIKEKLDDYIGNNLIDEINILCEEFIGKYPLDFDINLTYAYSSELRKNKLKATFFSRKALSINYSEMAKKIYERNKVDIKVYLLETKISNIPISNIYTPLLIGGENVSEQMHLCDNISPKYDYYGELTAIYWIWKNSMADYIGINYQDKYFRYNMRSNSIANDQDIEKMLLENDIVLSYKAPLKFNIKDRLSCEIINTVREIIVKICPDYEKNYLEVIEENLFFEENLFITNKTVFYNYCKWLFLITFEYEKIEVDLEDMTLRKTNYNLLSKILFNTWINKQNLKQVNSIVLNSFHADQVR